MNRQAINLLGGLVAAVLVLLGVVLGVLPHWQQARSDAADRQSVALQNQAQQTLIAGLAAQRQQLPQLQAQVAALEQQIPSAPRLDHLIDLTTGLPAGAVLRTITPGTATADATTPATASTTGFQQVPVTLTIDLRQPADAAQVLDRLRAGPRLLAIDEATVGQGSGTGSAEASLTVTGRVFLNPGATS
jgi:type II secretory pathway pseudopilin PulG